MIGSEHLNNFRVSPLCLNYLETFAPNESVFCVRARSHIYNKQNVYHVLHFDSHRRLHTPRQLFCRTDAAFVVSQSLLLCQEAIVVILILYIIYCCSFKIPGVLTNHNYTQREMVLIGRVKSLCSIVLFFFQGNDPRPFHIYLPLEWLGWICLHIYSPQPTQRQSSTSATSPHKLRLMEMLIMISK